MGHLIKHHNFGLPHMVEAHRALGRGVLLFNAALLRTLPLGQFDAFDEVPEQYRRYHAVAFDALLADQAESDHTGAEKMQIGMVGAVF
jgi:hypothetical protein